MRPPADATEFRISDELWRILRETEINCVGACCGREAFDFDLQFVRDCHQPELADDLSAARRELPELIAALERIPGPVTTFMITDQWTGPEAAVWFSEFRDALEAAG